MRYTPQGAAVCTFGVATNRNWTTDTREKKEDVEFHNIVAWNKLAEICSQYLKKGGKVYVEGRLSTSTWQAPDGAQRNKTEVVINDMVMLDRKTGETTGEIDIPTGEASIPESGTQTQEAPAEVSQNAADDKKSTKKSKSAPKEEAPADEDIPF